MKNKVNKTNILKAIKQTANEYKQGIHEWSISKCAFCKTLRLTEKSEIHARKMCIKCPNYAFVYHEPFTINRFPCYIRARNEFNNSDQARRLF